MGEQRPISSTAPRGSTVRCAGMTKDQAPMTKGSDTATQAPLARLRREGLGVRGLCWLARLRSVLAACAPASRNMAISPARRKEPRVAGFSSCSTQVSFSSVWRVLLNRPAIFQSRPLIYLFCPRRLRIPRAANSPHCPAPNGVGPVARPPPLSGVRFPRFGDNRLRL